MQNQAKVVEELQQALRQQDEASVGRILMSLAINSEKSDGGITDETFHQVCRESFAGLDSSDQSYWSNLAQQQQQSYTS